MDPLHKPTAWLIAFALTVVGVFVVAWLMVPNLRESLGALTSGPTYQTNAIGLGAVVVAATLVWSLHLYRREQQNLRACVELIADLRSTQDISRTVEELFPNNEQATLWNKALSKIREAWKTSQDAVLEANHSRNGAEVRLKKITDYCKQLEQIFGMIEEPVLAVNGFRELFFANQPAKDFLEKVQAPDPESTSMQVLRDCNSLVTTLQETCRRASTSNRYLEVDLPTAQGNNVSYRASIKTLTNVDSGEISGAMACLTDISTQRELQRKHDQFVSNVSHEMKTPLSGIRGYIELLLDDDIEDPETRNEFLGIIDSQAQRLQRLIDNLLNIARIEAGVVNVSKNAESLNSLVEEAMEIIKVQAEQKSITLVSELSSMYLGVFVDRDMMMQTAINLLSNAIKYTNSGGKVTVRSFMDDPFISFSVTDTGVGLTTEDQDKVFEKFYRVKKNEKMAGGTGLGLPLAKHIVEDVHNGKLNVKSVLGEGSTFSVSLPKTTMS